MKKTIIIGILLLIVVRIHAGNYFISSSSGSDSNDGKSPQTAWKSIPKLNSAKGNLLPGDSVLFYCNDTFWGQIVVSKSGNASKSIYYGSYGSGNKPIISGKTTVSNWTQTSTNIWSATCTECNGSVTNFFINDIPQQIGRWPNVTDANKGYRTFNSHSGKTQITDNTLSDEINWTGAEAVVRSVRWELNRFKIKSQNKGTLEFTSAIGFTFLNGFGYFIQNDPRTLDQQGEWYFNPSTKQFTIFSKTDPYTIGTKATNCDTLIKLNGVKYITIENIHFDGAGRVAISATYCNHIIFRNNEITGSGINAVEVNGSDYLTFSNNLINKTNNDALFISNSNHSTIQNNVIKKSGIVAGMGLSEWHYLGSYVTGNNNLIEFNTIDSSGYNGMIFGGDSIMIRNNIVSNFCMVKDDGGAFYTSGTQKNYSRKLIGNIIYNGIGAPEGSGWAGIAAEGIYMDEGASNVDILNNTVFNCSNKGIMIHNSNHIKVKGNNVYNNRTQLFLQHDAPTRPITNCVIDSNHFVSKQASQEIMEMTTSFNDIPEFGSFDYNYYCRPLGDDFVFWFTYYDNGGQFYGPLSLSGWSSKYNQDMHSGKSPIAVNAYTVHSVISSNYITNGSFDSNIKGWYSWANYNNSKLSFAPGSGVTGGAIRAEFTPPSGKADGMMYLISNNFAFSTDKTYRLRFDARSNKAETTTLQVIPRKNDNPYNLVADQKNFPIDNTYKQFEYVFTPNLNESNSRIDFQITEGQGDLWFDNIELEEVNATMTNPDDYIRFEFNATKKDATIALNDSYVDVKGMSVSGNIVLKPFTSIILFKKQCSGIVPTRPDTIFGDLNVCPGTSITYSIAPVPGATYYIWKLPDGWTGTSNSNDITAIAGDTGGVLSVIARNVCDSSLVQTLSVIANPIPTTPVITLNNGILQSNATDGNQWYVNNNIIQNAINDTYIPSLKGNYYVQVTLNGCSSKLSNFISFNPTDIDEMVDNNEISIYPNPTTGIVKINLNNHFSSDYIVDIFDNVGGLVQTLKKSKSDCNFNIDVTVYSTGVYLMHIYNSDKNYKFKIVKMEK